MTRTTRRAPIAPRDPLDQAVIDGSAGIAKSLGEVIATLSAFDPASIKGLIHRLPANGLGKYQYLESVGLTEDADLSAIQEGVKEQYGGGNFKISVFAGGKTRHSQEFSIAGPAKDPQTAVKDDTMGTNTILTLMMTMNSEARRDAQEQQRFALEQQRLRDDRAAEDRRASNALILSAAGLIVPAVLPLFGNREKLSEIVAMMQATKGKDSSLKDTVETFVLLKSLMDNGDKAEPFNPEDIAGSIARMAGPILGAAGRAFAGARGQAQPSEAEPAPAGDGMLHLPAPDPAAAPADPPPLPQPTGVPLLDLIRPDVSYFFARRHDPGLAAEAIVDIMERANVKDADVYGLVATFTSATDWKGDLAAAGIDLRADPEWADEFLAELQQLWLQRSADSEPEAGGAGRVADAAPDGKAGRSRKAVNGHTEAGA